MNYWEEMNVFCSCSATVSCVLLYKWSNASLAKYLWLNSLYMRSFIFNILTDQTFAPCLPTWNATV